MRIACGVLAITMVLIANSGRADVIMLEGTAWNVAGDPAQDGRTVSFLAEGRFSGFGGCNRVMGQFRQDGTELTFSNVAMTRRACVSEAMSRETEFIDVLARVRGFAVGTAGLQFLDGTGAAMLTLEPQEP